MAEQQPVEEATLAADSVDIAYFSALRNSALWQAYYQATRWSILAFAKPYLRISYHGWRNLPETGPVIVACNHASHLDPPLMGACFPRQLAFLGKSELFKAPLGPVIRRLGAFPIKRGAGDRAAMRLVIQLLDEGWPVLMFPEGTRTQDGNLQEPQMGISMIVMQRPEVPILPVRLDGTFQALGPGRKFPSPAKVRVTVGKPFTIKELEGLPTVKKQLYRAVADRIMDKIRTASA